MIARLVATVLFGMAGAASAQQAVTIPVPVSNVTLRLNAQLYRPAVEGPVPAVAIFHGCGGVGMNNARMAGLLQSWGYAALVVDSFSARGLKDVCGRNWPTQRDAEARVPDIDHALLWLSQQSFVAAERLAFMGYSYGGGVGLLRAFTPPPDSRVPRAKASVLVYPDCGLGAPLGADPRPQHSTMFALAEFDDWTPAAECQALIGRVTQGRERVEARIYPGAHHSFDALGLPVRYLEGVGNRSKPGGCCGAHYGANEGAWKAFVADTRAFLATHLSR